MQATTSLLDNRATATGTGRPVPLVAHVIYRLAVGGLENGVVNLINRMPPERFRHAIICLTDYSDFHRRIRRPDVSLFSLNKPRGNSPTMLVKLWRLMRRLRPDIVHTRNLAALDAVLPAMLAGVPVRIHGEHGRDVDDLDGSSVSRQRLRRLYQPVVDHYITVSRDLASYLEHRVGVAPARITQIYNGVNTDVFFPTAGAREPLDWHAGEGSFVIGTVGRMQEVKDQLTLARAFVDLARRMPPGARSPRLVMIGDGPLRERAETILAEAGLRERAWLPGPRDDVARIMRGLDLFVLPSLAEGISNTILEAMATGLPVVATAVGGNPELVQDGVTGSLVPPNDPPRMAEKICAYAEDPALCRRHGEAGRARIDREFHMDSMVNAYMSVYDRLLVDKRISHRKRRTL